MLVLNIISPDQMQLFYAVSSGPSRRNESKFSDSSSSIQFNDPTMLVIEIPISLISPHPKTSADLETIGFDQFGPFVLLPSGDLGVVLV